MENAKAAVRQTLDQVKAFLAQESPPKLSEADTKANFIEPIIAALGWTGIGVVTREYYVKNSQEFIDYVMRGSSGLLLAVESKALQADLADKAAAQLLQYCSVEGIEWAALTNGRELQFFNTFLKPDLAAKRILSLDLLAFNNDAEYDALFAQLWQLSRQSMMTPTGVRNWLNQRRLDATLRGIVLNPASPTTRQLRKALAEADIRATPQDIVQWFRSHLGTPIAALPHPSQRHAAPQPQENGAISVAVRTADPVALDVAGDDLFNPGASDVFGGEHKRLLPLFDALRSSVDHRVPSAKWRALKHYVAAEREGGTFLAVKRRAQMLVIGLALPQETASPRVADNAREFNWARITKVVRIAAISEIDELLLSLIQEASLYVDPATTGSKHHYGISLGDLLKAGLLQAEERLVLATTKRDVATARLSSSGEIIWQENSYTTPSDRAFAALLGRQSLNGWTAWFVERPEGRASLADVRARLQAELSQTGT